jgi:hypothetical protein
MTDLAQDNAIRDYQTRELLLRHDAEEAKRLGDFAWERYCRWAAVVLHVAMVDETVDRQPDDLP